MLENVMDTLPGASWTACVCVGDARSGYRSQRAAGIHAAKRGDHRLNARQRAAPPVLEEPLDHYQWPILYRGKAGQQAVLDAWITGTLDVELLPAARKRSFGETSLLSVPNLAAVQAPMRAWCNPHHQGVGGIQLGTGTVDILGYGPT